MTAPPYLKVWIRHWYLFIKPLTPNILPEWMMASCNVVLNFESVDKIEWCDHSRETSSAIVLFVFHHFTEMEFWLKQWFLKTPFLPTDGCLLPFVFRDCDLFKRLSRYLVSVLPGRDESIPGLHSLAPRSLASLQHPLRRYFWDRSSWTFLASLWAEVPGHDRCDGGIRKRAPRGLWIFWLYICSGRCFRRPERHAMGCVKNHSAFYQ